MFLPIELLVIVSLISPILCDCSRTIGDGNWTVIISTYRAYGIGDKYNSLLNVTGGIPTQCEYATGCNININTINSVNDEYFKEELKKIVRSYLKDYKEESTTITYLPVNEKIYPVPINYDEEIKKGIYFDRNYNIFYIWNANEDNGVFCYQSSATESVLDEDETVQQLTFRNQNSSVTLQRSEETILTAWKTNQDYVMIRKEFHCLSPISFTKFASLVTSDHAPPSCDLDSEELDPEEPSYERLLDGALDPTLIVVIALVGIFFFIFLIMCCIWRCMCSASYYAMNRTDHKLQPSFTKQIERNDKVCSYLDPLEPHEYCEPGSLLEKVYDLQGNRIQPPLYDEIPTAPLPPDYEEIPKNSIPPEYEQIQRAPGDYGYVNCVKPPNTEEDKHTNQESDYADLDLLGAEEDAPKTTVNI
uniref:Uncharacterized protein LOC114332309 isoform X2 n=1 Tax=Diabrotica virgifera virgifera TaxID=50390 RepID=A0A6P7FNJ8_DIAVI